MFTECVTTIDAAPSAVWEVLIDPDRVQEWMPEVVSYKTNADQGPGVGTKSTMSIKEGSKVVDYETEILTYEPNDRMVIEMRGGNLGSNPMQVSYTLAPAGNKTTLTYCADWKPGALMLRLILGLMSPLIRWAGGRKATKTLARLADVVSRSES